METCGYIVDKRTNEIIKILVRQGKKIDKFCYVINLKLRKTGISGLHLTDEEEYLNNNIELLNDLKNGENVYC